MKLFSTAEKTFLIGQILENIVDDTVQDLRDVVSKNGGKAQSNSRLH